MTALSVTHVFTDLCKSGYPQRVIVGLSHRGRSLIIFLFFLSVDGGAAGLGLSRVSQQDLEQVGTPSPVPHLCCA